MLDASKYAQHFPDEQQDVAAVPAPSTATPAIVAPSPALLTALHQLEREFSEILRAQQPEATDHSE